MRDPISDNLVVAPDDEEVKEVQTLADAFDEAETIFVRCDDGDDIALPRSAREGLERLVSYLAADVAVAMTPYDEVLTTQEAADLLGMSRPYLVHLLETEAIPIPAHRVGPGAGGHRRIMLRDVLAYRETRDLENEARISRSLGEVQVEAAARRNEERRA